MYAWSELLKLWETERLSIEQVIGQLAAMEQRVAALEGQRK